MKIIEVNYKGGYMVSVKFENGKYKEFDFYDFIFYTDNKIFLKYRDKRRFRHVRISDGSLAWGKWDEFSFFCAYLYKLKYTNDICKIPPYDPSLKPKKDADKEFVLGLYPKAKAMTFHHKINEDMLVWFVFNMKKEGKTTVGKSFTETMADTEIQAWKLARIAIQKNRYHK